MPEIKTKFMQILTKSNTQKIAVRVWDLSDDGPQPRGKQVEKLKEVHAKPYNASLATMAKK